MWAFRTGTCAQISGTTLNINPQSAIRNRRRAPLRVAFGYAGGGLSKQTAGFMPKDYCDCLRQIFSGVLFDGDHWNVLAEDFPVTGDEIRTFWYKNELDMYIRTEYIDITVDSYQFGVRTMNDIPRNYLGGFTTRGLGSCQAIAYSGWIDDLSLTGGVLVDVTCTPATPAACCLPDGSCVVLTGSACVVLTGAACDAAGGKYQGVGTTCDQVTYCPFSWPDIDQDGDVDQQDFGQFQACYTGSYGVAMEGQCACLNRHGEDDDIDLDDFLLFEECFTGPTILMDPGTLPAQCFE